MKAIVLGGVIASLASLLGTRFLIQYMARKGYGQFIRDDGPTTHHAKRGTPTMGGLAILGAVVLAYIVAHLATWQPPTLSGLLVLWLALGLGVVGFLDDYIKISRERSLGLGEGAKIAGQIFVGLVFAVLALIVPDERGVRVASHYISFTRDLQWASLQIPGIAISGFVLAIVWIIVMVMGTSNAVNIADGVDGLCTGACSMVFGAYGLMNIWQRNQWCAKGSTAGPLCYEARDPMDLALVAISFAAAAFCFLWWNAKPAKIIMGDTGSLSMGGAIAGLAICTRTELLLVILGGLFVMEMGSSILQRYYFKATKRPGRPGKRLFKMAPIHHHFELLGWNEVTVVIRFWIICGLCVSAALGIFYAEWVSAQ